MSFYMKKLGNILCIFLLCAILLNSSIGRLKLSNYITKFSIINNALAIQNATKEINKEQHLENNNFGFILEVIPKNHQSLLAAKFISNSNKKLILAYEDNEINLLKNNFFILDIQKNHLRTVHTLPNDTLYNGSNVSILSKTNQWNLEQLGFTKINNPNSVWNTTTGSKDTIIAVIDTGIDITNPDIINWNGSTYGPNNLWVNQREIPDTLKPLIDTDGNSYISAEEIITYYVNNSLDINGDGNINYLDILENSNNPNHIRDNIDNDGNEVVDDIFGYNFGDNNPNINDLHGHGTHVAGIIGAVSNNNIGISSICWNCLIMNIKVSTGATGNITDNNLISGIKYAVNNGAKIINLSLGGPGYNKFLEDTVKYAWDNGVLVVASAGNNMDDTSKFYPASHPFVLAVGSLNHDETLSFFSNKGPRLDIATFGRSILSTAINTGTYNNTCLVNPLPHYACLSGTSMSSPHVSALAGLLYDMHKNDPSPWSARDIRNAILKTAKDLGTTGFDNIFGFGNIDPTNALSFAGFTQPDNTSPIVSVNGLSNTYNKGILTINGTVSDNDLYIYTVSFQPIPNFTLREFAGRENKINSQLFSINTVTENILDGQYSLILRAEDFYGNNTQININNIFIDNTPPANFNLVSPSQNTLINNNQVNFTWTNATDNISDVTYDFYLNNNLIATNLNTNSYTLTNPDLLNEGNNTWKVIAKDFAGNTKESETSNFIVDRVPPNPFNIQVQINLNHAIINFSTTDNTSGVNHYKISLNNSDFSLVTSPHEYSNLPDGVYTVRVRAFDFSGLYTESTATFNITYTCNTRKSKADFNCDGIVNITDLSILAASWNKNNNGDANGDNNTNLSDLSILAANWNKNF